MDADKLNEAAGKDWCDNVLDRDLKPITKQAFKRGANWLMQQPLANRLTDEEKEKIKAKYNELKSLNSITNDMFADDTAILEWLFGKELFNEK